MGAQVQGNGNGRKGRFARARYAPMAEINVTPFVDVMLVLLIIFMVAAPLLNVGVPVDLPKTDAKPITGQDEPLVVSLDSKGDVFLQETKIDLADLATRLKAISGNKPDTRVFVRADKGIAYGRVMEVMGVLTTSGFSKVGLVAEQPAGSAAQPAAGSGGKK